MTDRPTDWDYDGERPTGDLAPELDNSQQAEPDQAQDIAGEALNLSTDPLGLDDTEKESGGISDLNTPDLVDHMKQMVTSGRIDMSAYSGEPDHDGDADNIRKQVNGGPGGDPDDEESVEDDLM